MKINILTFHFVENYGAQLQVYALQTYLQSLGHEVEILDFRPSKLINDYKLIHFNNFRKLVADLLRLNTRKKQINEFKDFIEEYLNLSSKQYYDDTLNIKNFVEQPDVFICGSDQIWNLPLSGYSDQYFLNFIDKNSCKKISYAASFGDSISDKDKELIAHNLKDFHAISVRENSSSNIINNLIHKEPVCVLDPVFLLNVNQWRKLSYYDTTLTPKSYILLYDLIGRGDQLLIKKAKIEAKRLNKKIVSIHPLTTKRYGVDYNLYDVGPREFIWLIDNAEMICTNSFHGTSFSLIFQKKFIVNHRKGKLSRTKALFKLLDIECKDNISMGPGEGIQFINKKNQRLLDSEKEKSMKFLQNSIGV